MKAALSELNGMAPDQQLWALKREYRKLGVDKYNYVLLFDLAKGASKGLPAPSWSHETQVTWHPEGTWPDEELMDLVQDFFTDKEWMRPRAKYEQSRKNDPSDRPIIKTVVNPETGEESVHNLMERAYYAPNVSNYRAVLSKGLEFTVHHRHKKLAVDNLLKRSRKILEAEPYQFTGKGSARLFFHGEPSRTPSTATDEELHRVACQVRQDFKPVERRTETNPVIGEPLREPQLYDTPTLELVLRKIADELPTGFTNPDLRKIFQKVFQFAFSSIPVPVEEGSTGEGTGGNLTVATRVAKELLAVLTPDEELILTRHVVGHDDPEAKIRQGDIDKELGVTPPTTKVRYRTLAAKFESVLEGLSKPDRDLAVSVLAEYLTEIELRGSTDA
jgi:hypothetical protein